MVHKKLRKRYILHIIAQYQDCICVIFKISN